MTKRHNRKCSTDGGKMIRYICTSLLAGLAVSGLSAQSEDEEDVFLLDPFEVSADSQTGYIATTAVTATKVGTLIKNTPLNIQVMTSEFLEDTAMLNFEDITKYSSSFSQDSVNGSNFNSVLNAGQRGNTVAASGITGEGRVGLNPPNSIRLRAFPISNILRNGLPRAGNHSLKGVDRVEIVKGPVAIFFGQSQPGGAINYVTKRPIDQFRFKATTRAGQFSLKAVEIDANVPISKNLGIRILSSYQDGEDWRQFSSGTEKYIAGIVKLELFDRITLVLEGERLERSYNPGGSPIVTNALYHNDYFNPPDEILFLPQDSEYGRNPWNRGFGREDTLRRWQATILRNRDNWINARNAAFPEEGYPPMINQFGFTGVEFYDDNKESFDNAVARVYGPDANFAGPHGRTQNITDVAYYELTVRPFTWLSLKASGNYGDGHRNFRLAGANMPYADMTFAGTRVNAGQSVTEFTNHIVDIATNFDLWGTSHKIIFGGEYRFSQDDRWRNGRSWTLELTQIYQYWDPRVDDYPPVPEIYPIHTGDPDDPGIFEKSDNIIFGRYRRLGAYLMHQGTFLKGRLHTMAGIRHENQKNESIQIAVLGWETAGVTSGTSQAVGFVYELSDTVNMYSSWNQNFQPNTQFSVTAGDAGDYNEQDLAERQYLDDETGTGIDLGLKVELLKGRLTGQLSLFHIEREGIARMDYERSLQRQLDEGWTDDSFRVNYYVNGGLERAQGFELELLAAPNPGWQILFGYTHYFQAEVVSDPSLADFQADAVIGRGLPNVSDHRVSIWNKYEFQDGPLEGLSIGGGLQYASDSKPLIYDWQYDITNDSYIVFDVRLGYKFSALKGDFDCALSYKNVTDEVYTSGGLGYSPPRSWLFSVSYTY